MSPENQTDPAYDALVEELAKECTCTGIDRPCDGLMAGGICDGLRLHEDDSIDSEGED